MIDTQSSQNVQEIFSFMQNTQSSQQVKEIFYQFQNIVTCPISQQLIENPVIASDCQTYQRQCIQSWLKIKKSSPITRQKIKKQNLITNSALKKLMELFTFKIKPILLNNQKIIQQKSKLILQLQNSIELKNHQCNDKEQQIIQNKKQIQNLKQNLKQKDQELKEKDEDLEEKHYQLEESNYQLKESNYQLEECNYKLRENEQKLKESQSNLKQNQQKLKESIQNMSYLHNSLNNRQKRQKRQTIFSKSRYITNQENPEPANYTQRTHSRGNNTITGSKDTNKRAKILQQTLPILKLANISQNFSNRKDLPIYSTQKKLTSNQDKLTNNFIYQSKLDKLNYKKYDLGFN